jgi:hypothetical protein
MIISRRRLLAGLLALAPAHAPGAGGETTVRDAVTGRPIRGATITQGTAEATSDDHGHVALTAIEPGALALVRAPGYQRRWLPLKPEATIALVPHVVKAVYLTYYGVGDRAIREQVLDLVERTELNAVVIDIKGDRGFIPYETAVPLAMDTAGRGPVRIRDFDGLLEGLKRRGVYTIARVVAFKDNVLAQERPGWAVLDARTGRPWLDRERLAWLDPFVEEAGNYIIAVAREAALKGFEEIQFDYLRFPGDGELGQARYSRPSTRTARIQAVTAFLERARRAIRPTGAFLAVDLFGYTAFNEGDTEIGQRIEDLAPRVDYLCPMAYPSCYHLGIPGYPNAVAHPYEIVRETVRRIGERAEPWAARVRPWIQDFRDYAFDRRAFGIPEVRAQMRAALESGATGWMVWNPRNEYTAGAFMPEAGRPE